MASIRPYDDPDIEDERDPGPPDPGFRCHACGDWFDEHERTVLTGHPMLVSVCLNCACG